MFVVGSLEDLLGPLLAYDTVCSQYLWRLPCFRQQTGNLGLDGGEFLRGVGLVAGVELILDKSAKTPFDLSDGIAKKLHYYMLERGLISRPVMNTLALAPPLIITKGDVDTIVETFQSALDYLERELVAGVQQ